MPVGVSITLDAKGGSAAASEAKKVEQGIRGIAKAEQEAAAMAKLRGQAQEQANRHVGAPGGGHIGGRGGAHSGWAGTFHAFGAGGGEAGHLGHVGSRLGRIGAHMGAGGLVAAGVGLAINAAIKASEEYAEGLGKLVERAHEIAHKMHEARMAAGESGLAYADSHGLAMRRLYTMGATTAEIKEGQAQGFTPEAMADLRRGKNWRAGMAVALAGRSYGADQNATAGQIAKMGGVPEGANANELAAYYASVQQDRVIGADEKARAIAGTVGTAQLDTLSGIRSRTTAAAIDNIENGNSGMVAADKLNKATSPEAYVQSAMYRETEEQTEVLRTIATNTNMMVQAFQWAMHKGGLGDKSATEKLEEHTNQAH